MSVGAQNEPTDIQASTKSKRMKKNKKKKKLEN